MSVTKFEAANVSAENGTWFAGSALSSHNVPLNRLSLVPPLFDDTVTIVPAGDLIEIWSWPVDVCVMNVFRLRSYKYGPTPETVSVDVTVFAAVAKIDFGTSMLSKCAGVEP